MTPEPIIQSFLDTDFYKFTMGQVVFRKFRDVRVKFSFKNRTNAVPLAKFIKEDDLRRELSHVQVLGLNSTEYKYLRRIYEYSERMFSDDFLQFLRDLRLPPYNLTYKNGELELEFEGPWSSVIYWEVPALAIINELYYRSQIEQLSKFERKTVEATGIVRLAEKIRILRNRPEITFTDFGTRRRFSGEWHEQVIEALSQELPDSQFRGTSNVYLAMKCALVPMGTSAHEMFMVMSGIMHGNENDIRRSHNEMLKTWWEQYGLGLSIALTDTYGSDFFFRDFTLEQAKNWRGLRQDSGDPISFGEKAIRFYQSHGIDPQEKLIVFSDGLDIETMIKIHEHFKGRVKNTFGWGTNLTNDLGLKPLSLVIKATEANGHGLVKLSDNSAKAIGKPENIERFKRIFGYSESYSQECKY